MYDRIKNENLLDKDIEVEYIPAPAGDNHQMKAHIFALHDVLNKHGIQLLIDWWIHGKENAWHTLLARLMGIGIVGSIRFDHNYEMIYRRASPYPHKDLLRVLQCLDKVFCLTISAEIYFRANGVDAIYLPNTVRYTQLENGHTLDPFNIAFLCRLHDEKKGLTDAAQIIAEVRKIYPQVILNIIGKFEDENKERVFNALINRLGIKNSIKMWGWKSDPIDILKNCGLFLSCSFMEGFPNSIAEAQACGLPVIMYELDITLARDNESIIMVRQHDIKGAAEIIVRLVGDRDRLLHLSQIARCIPARYSHERFKSELKDLFQNHDKLGKIRNYSPSDYHTAINTMAFYAGKSIPGK